MICVIKLTLEMIANKLDALWRNTQSRVERTTYQQLSTTPSPVFDFDIRCENIVSRILIELDFRISQEKHVA